MPNYHSQAPSANSDQLTTYGTWYSHRDTYPGPIIVQDLDLTLARASRPKILRRASFWFTATTVDTVPTATHNTTLSPASRALERGRSVRQYPTHVPDPLSSFAHAVWRFLLRRAAGRYAEHDLSDGIGANSCPCAFHWLCYLLGQPRLSESFSRGAPRGSLWVRQGPSFRSAFLGRIACPTATTTAAHSRHPRATSTLLAETAGQRLHRELVLRFLREISPQEHFSTP